MIDTLGQLKGRTKSLVSCEDVAAQALLSDGDFRASPRTYLPSFLSEATPTPEERVLLERLSPSDGSS